MTRPGRFLHTATTTLGRRRATLLGASAAAALLAPSAQAQAPGELLFRVLRRGSPIGRLHTTFARGGDRLTVRTRLELAVYVAFVRVFNYLHVSEEVWQGSKLLSITADTNDDGKAFRVRAVPDVGGVRVEGPLATVTAPAESLTTNCGWNPAFVRQQMLIDCEKGRHVPLAVQPLGEKTLTVLGASRTATGYRTKVPYADGEIWYTGDQWVHAVFQTKGETLVYERER
jgi:hypothetical protein